MNVRDKGTPKDAPHFIRRGGGEPALNAYMETKTLRGSMARKHSADS